MTADPFRIRDHVPEFEVIVQEIRERSAATRARLPMTTVCYDEQSGLTVDLFFPKSVWVPAPVHMFVHGGDYWRMPSKSDYSYVADTITAAGAVAAIIDYGSMPSVGMDVLVDQVRRAKTWLCTHISEYNCDSRRLTISGHSAGAHLAALSLVGASSGVKAALLLGGIYDLKQRQLSFLRSELSITDEDAARFTPLTQTYDPDVAVTLLVGADETAPFHSQAAAFERHLKSQGLLTRLEVLPGRNQMSSVRDLGLVHTKAGSQLAELIGSS